MISILIPAHNEQAGIARCLESLQQGLPKDYAEIVVVCNGCTDSTAEIARAYDFVKVIEVEKPSKVNAINVGESHLNHFPRIYLDADLIISGEDITRMVAAFDQEGVFAIAPKMLIDERHSSWFVKAYHKIWQMLPYYANRLGGAFALSEQGRKRFSEFPDIIADDAFVRAHFEESERFVPKDCSFTAVAPKNLSDLIKIKTRSRFGNVELVKKFPHLNKTSDNQPGNLTGIVLRKPWLLPAALVYVYVKLQIVRGVKKRLQENDFTTWERDESSRSI